MIEMACTINGEKWAGAVAENRILADFLRDEAGLVGTRIACNHASCGACTVLLNRVPVAACATFAFEAADGTVLTIEGLQDAEGGLHPLQRHLASRGVFQCGYCASGMILLAKALLDVNRHPTRPEIVEWMSANVCRCTGYEQIIAAIAEFAEGSEMGIR